MELKWVDGFKIQVRTVGGEVILSANREGLLSLAGHLIMLADEVPGSHIHLDEHNSLEDHSDELIIERMS